jgi:Tol biopolymer transport system component
MNLDGSNPVQLTNGKTREAFFPPVVRPDGRWVIYSNEDGLWKISIDGGSPERVTDHLGYGKAISPDGQRIAYLAYEREGGRVLEVMSFAGGAPINTLELPPTASARDFQFSGDGKSVLFLDSRNGTSNIWSLPLDGSQPKQVTNFKANQIFDFAFSRDGKQLAFTRGETASDVVMIAGFKK